MTRTLPVATTEAAGVATPSREGEMANQCIRITMGSLIETGPVASAAVLITMIICFTVYKLKTR
jgi:hypothetical protein